jgi:DNA-directed RNA polymerase subunit RPC12/RpoP
MHPLSNINLVITKTQYQKGITSDSLKKSQYKCWSCRKEFRTEQGFKSHNTRVHNKQTNYKCNGCDAEFPYPSTLKVHKKIHLITRKHALKQIAVKRKTTTDALTNINSKQPKITVSTIKTDVSLPNNTTNISLTKQQKSTAFDKLHILSAVATDRLKQEYPSSLH